MGFATSHMGSTHGFVQQVAKDLEGGGTNIAAIAAGGTAKQTIRATGGANVAGVSASGAALASAFDPSSVAWSGWFREDYTSVGGLDILISQWTDKSINARHLTGGVSNRPTVGAKYLGFPTYDFGTSKKLTGSDIAAYFTSTAFTMFAVVNASAANTTQNAGNSYLLAQILANQTNATIGMGIDSVGPSIRPFAQDGGGVKTPATQLALTLSEWDLYEMRLEGGTLYTRKNNGTEQSVTCGTVVAFTGTTIVGCNYNQTVFFNGSMIELALADTALGSSTRQSYRDYAIARYGIV